jgi:putative spermidine/putrescine transport system permease protein
MGAIQPSFRYFIYIVGSLVLVFEMAPLLVTLAISFSNGPFATFPPNGVTLRWYAKLLGSQEFLEAAILSIGLAVTSTVSSLLLGVPAAFALDRGRFRGRAFFHGLLLSPLVFPVLITGLALLQSSTWSGMRVATVNMFFGYTLVALPYVVRTVSASLQLADRSLEEAARTLGATPLSAFRRVTVPQILPGIIAGAMFSFMMGLDNYTVAMWFSDAQVSPLPILMMQSMTRVFDPSISAMAGMMILVGAIVIILMEKFIGIRRAMGI